MDNWSESFISDIQLVIVHPLPHRPKDVGGLHQARTQRLHAFASWGTGKKLLGGEGKMF